MILLHCEAEQLKVVSIDDFERLGGINNGKIAWPANLFMLPLSVASAPGKLQEYKDKLFAATRDVRTQAQNAMAGRRDA
jgi:hypothetical protein